MSRLLMCYSALKYTCRVLDVLVVVVQQWRVSQMAIKVVHPHKLIILNRDFYIWLGLIS
jgi:hypothetical protein